VQYDVGVEMSQFARRWRWDTWHPVIHVLFLNWVYYIGKFITGGSILGGFFVHSVVQMSILAATFAYSIKRLREHGVAGVFLWALLAIYMFFPQNPYMGMITIKDTLFTCFCVFFFLKTIDFIKTQSTKNLIWFIITGFLFCIGRKNGAIAFYASAPFLLIFLWQKATTTKIYRRFIVGFEPFFKGEYSYHRMARASQNAWTRNRMMIIGLAGIIILNIVFNLSLPLFDIAKGNSREAYSIPMMQVYKTYTTKNLPEEQRQLIENLFGNPGDWNAFNAHFADKVKDRFDTRAFDNNKSKYIKLYFNLFAKYPAEFLATALNLNIYYWYPASEVPAAGSRSSYMERIDINPTWWLEEKLIIGRETSKWLWALEVLEDFYPMKFAKYLPFLLPSFAIYLSLFAAIILLLKRRKSWVLLFPLLFMWITIVAGPVTDARYNYPFTILAPILLLYALYEKTKSLNE